MLVGSFVRSVACSFFGCTAIHCMVYNISIRCMLGITYSDYLLQTLYSFRSQRNEPVNELKNENTCVLLFSK